MSCVLDEALGKLKSIDEPINEAHWETTDNLDKRYVDDPEDKYDAPKYIIFKVWNNEYDYLVHKCIIEAAQNGLAYDIKQLLKENLREGEVIETEYSDDIGEKE